jgi:sterol desaturase/sphingolipid hydroxylase (fatty acid hydroxylase superfamily)
MLARHSKLIAKKFSSGNAKDSPTPSALWLPSHRPDKSTNLSKLAYSTSSLHIFSTAVNPAFVISMYSLNLLDQLPCALFKFLPTALTPRTCVPPSSILSTTYNILTSPLSSTYISLRTAMDALLSVPFLSLLLIPTMTSYSTSLNLLFFYLTWSTLVLSHPLRVEIVATLAVRILFYLLPSTLFLLFDALLPGAAEGFKAMGSTGLPLKDAKRERYILVGKTVLWSLGNLFLGVLCQAGIEVLLTRYLGVRSALKVTTSLPMPWGIFMDLIRGFVFREIFGYLLHRFALHDARSPITRYHEEWYHSLSAPFPLSASYDHPIAYLLRSFIPTFGPALLFRFHLLTYIAFLSLVSLEETFTHSGYSTVPTNFILGGIARRADAHVVSGGEGNFGPWGIIDWVCGTTVGTDVIDDLRGEAEKHDMEGKMDMAVRKAKKEAGQLKARTRRRRQT